MRLLHYCGLPVEDVDFINSDGKTMNKILLEVGALDSLLCASLATILVRTSCEMHICGTMAAKNL